MSPKLKLVIIGVTALCAVILIAAAQMLSHTTQTAYAEIGGPFKLASSKGGELNSASLIGKPYGVFFGFTHCPEVCPTTLYEMTKTFKDVGDNAKDFRLLFITVDPERDTAPILKDYLSNFDPRIEGLTPTPEQLPQIAKAFHVYYERVNASDGEYTMNHTATIYLMDRDGHFKSTIAYDENKESRVQKIKNLFTD